MAFFRSATLVLAIACMLASCAGSPETRGPAPREDPAEGSVLYETDFSAEDGMFGLHEGVELSGGALRFDGDNPHSGFRIPYGQDSITEFSLRTEEAQAQAEVHVLHNHEVTETQMHESMPRDEAVEHIGR